MSQVNLLPYLEVRIFDNPIPTLQNSIRLSKRLGQIGTLDFRCETKYATNIQVGQKVTLHESMRQTPWPDNIIEQGGWGGTKIFEGTVDRVTQAVHSGGPPGFAAIGWATEVSCVDLMQIPMRVNGKEKTWPKPLANDPELTVDKIVREVLAEWLTDDAIAPGQILKASRIDAYTVNYDTIYSIFDDLARTATALQSGPPRWVWNINEERQLDFFFIGAFDCPVKIGGDGGLKPRANPRGDTGTLSFTESRENYANRIIFRIGHYVLDPVTEYFFADGVSKAWNVTKPINNEPQIKLRPAGADFTIVQSVGINGLDNPPQGEGRDFYYNAGSNTIWADGPPPGGAEIAVTYAGQDNRVIIKDLDEAKPGFGASDRRTVEGGSGVYVRMVDLTDPATSQNVDQLASSYMWQWSQLGQILRIEIWDPNLTVQRIKVGQKIGAIVTDLPTPATDWLVRSIDMHEEYGVLWRTLELVNGSLLADSMEYMQDLMAQGAPAAQKTDQHLILRTATAKFDAPKQDDESDWSETLTTAGTPYYASISIKIPSQKEDYLVDWQYNTGDPTDPDTGDETWKTADDANAWKSVFGRNAEGDLLCLIIPKGETVGFQIGSSGPGDPYQKYKPHVEFPIDATRLKSVILKGPEENLQGEGDGQFMTTQLSWR